MAAPDASSHDDSQKQTSAPLVWGPIRTVSEDRADRPLRDPAAVFDPVVGTVVVWPASRDVEVLVKAPGKKWGDPVVIDDGVHAESVQVSLLATDGHGSLTTAWVRTLGSGARNTYQLLTSTRSRSGNWSDPTVLWEAPYLDALEGEAPISNPSLAVGSDGSAALAWNEESLTNPRDEEGYYHRSWASYRPAGGDWEQPSPLGPRHFGDDWGWVEDVVVDGQGVATVAAAVGGDLFLFRNVGDRWGSGERVIEGGDADLEVAPDGAADLVSHTGSPVEGASPGMFHYGVAATHTDDGESWSPPERLAPGSAEAPTEDSFSNPSVALHSGAATYVFASDSGPVLAVTRESGGDYGAPARIAPEGPRSAGLDALGVWANPSGQALTIWGSYMQGGAGAWQLQASYRPSEAGKWSAPFGLSGGRTTTGEPGAVTAVVYPSGSVLTLWSNEVQIFARGLGSPE